MVLVFGINGWTGIGTAMGTGGWARGCEGTATWKAWPGRTPFGTVIRMRPEGVWIFSAFPAKTFGGHVTVYRRDFFVSSDVTQTKHNYLITYRT
jgi:hypothetical protein